MKRSAIDLLLDEEYDGPIELVAQDGRKMEFVEIALIPFDKKIYAILVEKSLFDAGEIENSGRVFELNPDKDLVTEVLNVNTISQVFEVYDKLFDEME